MPEPASAEAAAATLREAAEAGRVVRPVGGGTKQDWGAPGREPDLELSTRGLDRIVEHNSGDLTAVVEAGVPLAAAQERFAQAGQMLALDPPDGGATLGGLVATGDTGPLRTRYGAPRDLVVGIRAALPDGSVARAGGKVIKNVAGYDLAKLFCGSLGTLGVVVELALRLHPLPAATCTVVVESSDRSELAELAGCAAAAPLEPEALDVRWEAGHCALLARFAGAAAAERAEAAARLLGGAPVPDDDELWEAQRAGQRSSAGTVVRVSARPGRLGAVLEAAARHDAPLVGRAGLGLAWLRLEHRSADETAAAVEAIRRELAPAASVLTGAPREVRERLDAWGSLDPAALELMRRVKERFDPSGACNPGVFAGGI